MTLSRESKIETLDIPFTPAQIDEKDFLPKNENLLTASQLEFLHQHYTKSKEPVRYDKETLREAWEKDKTRPKLPWYGVIYHPDKRDFFILYKGKKAEKHLGEGGFGKVKILKIEEGKFCKLKIFSGALYAKEAKNEFDILQRLHQKDPSICFKLNHYSVSRGAPVACLVSPLQPGISYDEYKAVRKTLSLIRQLQIAVSMLQALQALHEAGIFHGDLKADNLTYLPGEASTRLIDMGRAKMIHPETGRAKHTQPPHNWRYRAPELTAIDGRYVSNEKTEVFAIGITLINLLLPSSSLGRLDFALRMELYQLLASLIHPDPTERTTLINCITNFNAFIKNLPEKDRIQKIGLLNVSDCLANPYILQKSLKKFDEICFVDSVRHKDLEYAFLKQRLEKIHPSVNSQVFFLPAGGSENDVKEHILSTLNARNNHSIYQLSFISSDRLEEKPSPTLPLLTDTQNSPIIEKNIEAVLTVAVRNQDHDAVSTLLQQHPRLTVSDTIQPFHYAIEIGNQSFVQDLLKNRESLATSVYCGDSALSRAAYCGFLNIVTYLIEHTPTGKDTINITNHRKLSPLLEAAGHDHLLTVKYLLLQGATGDFDKLTDQKKRLLPSLLLKLCPILDKPENPADTSIRQQRFMEFKERAKQLVRDFTSAHEAKLEELVSLFNKFQQLDRQTTQLLDSTVNIPHEEKEPTKKSTHAVTIRKLIEAGYKSGDFWKQDHACKSLETLHKEIEKLKKQVQSNMYRFFCFRSDVKEENSLVDYLEKLLPPLKESIDTIKLMRK